LILSGTIWEGFNVREREVDELMTRKTTPRYHIVSNVRGAYAWEECLDVIRAVFPEYHHRVPKVRCMEIIDD